MTLKEFLNTLPDDCDIKIGMKDGSSFVYVGPISDLSINVLTRQCRRAILTAAENADKRVSATLHGMPKPLQVYISEQASEGVETIPVPKWVNVTAAKMIEAYNRAVRNQDDAHAHVETFAPVGQRQVIDVFRAYEKPHPTVVMVEGYEVGKYCLVSEHVSRADEQRLRHAERQKSWTKRHPERAREVWRRSRMKKTLEAYGYGQERKKGRPEGPADTE